KLRTLVFLEKQPTPGQLAPNAGRPLTAPAPNVTTLPSLVSTSAKKGAMITRFVPVRPNGVNCASGASKVTLPLLFTNRLANVLPKKLVVKPRDTGPVDPSSLPGSVLVSNPGRIAPSPGVSERRKMNDASSLSPVSMSVVVIVVGTRRLAR